MSNHKRVFFPNAPNGIGCFQYENSITLHQLLYKKFVPIKIDASTQTRTNDTLEQSTQTIPKPKEDFVIIENYCI